MYNLQNKLNCPTMYNKEMVVGRIVKIDLEFIKAIANGLTPKWYSSDSFEIIGTDHSSDIDRHKIAYLDKSLPFIESNDNYISMEYLKIDIVGERKKKLERISNV